MEQLREWLASDDEAMNSAMKQAGATLRFFLREMMFERNRIVPAVSVGSVKKVFAYPMDGQTGFEYMWITDVWFDGRDLRGTLANDPDNVKGVAAGDALTFPLEEVVDWILALGDQVYGAFTIHVLRSRMPPEVRQDHDQAWDLPFGDPEQPMIVPHPPAETVAERLGPGKVLGEEDHLMSFSLAEGLADFLRQHPDEVHRRGEDGLGMLHHNAVAGSVPLAKLVLAAGADPTMKTATGVTALSIAEQLGWTQMAALLRAAGA